MISEIPTLSVLKAIAPTPESKEAPVLQYDELGPQVGLQRPFEYERMHRFWDAEPGSLAESKAGKQLAMYYMILGADALRLSATEKNKDLWSDRYTRSTSELYGRPDPALAKELWDNQVSPVEQETLPFQEAAERLGDYLNTTYKTVFDALNLDQVEDAINADEVAKRFEAGIAQLARDHDNAWDDWTVARNEKGDILSVDGSKKQIIVGMRRAEMTPAQLKGLFAHEVLVHAQRALNGAKIDDELAKGLSGYIDMEEGLGVFVEYALTGSIPEKNIDRYVDIAYALGDIDGTMHTRAEVVTHALERANARNEQRQLGKSEAQIRSEVYTHVNRIYRGSRGDEHIGIYTKDISYHMGFMRLGAYMSEAHGEGQDISNVFEYLIQGKFDPTDEAHIRYLQEATL